MVASNTEHLYQQQIQRNRKIIQQSATDIHLMTGNKTYKRTAAKQNLAHNTHSLCKLPLLHEKKVYMKCQSKLHYLQLCLTGSRLATLLLHFRLNAQPTFGLLMELIKKVQFHIYNMQANAKSFQSHRWYQVKKYTIPTMRPCPDAVFHALSHTVAGQMFLRFCSKSTL